MKSYSSIFFIIISGIVVLAILGVLLLSLNTFILSFVAIAGRSMEPTLQNNQTWILNKFIYKQSDIERYDIVIYKREENLGQEFVGRIIGVPNDQITKNQGYLIIRGVKEEGSYINKSDQITSRGLFLTDNVSYTIPQNSYFILGDNRSHSNDSFSFGPVKKENIIGKLWFCIQNCNK